MRKLIVAAAVLLTSLAGAARADKLVLVGGTGDGGDGGPATKAKLVAPFAVGSDAAGNLYLSEYEGQRIRKIAPDGIISTIAGNGTKGFAGDGGPATASQISGPHHLLVAPAGDVYIADTYNNRVRKIDGKTGIISTVAGTGQKGFGGDGGPATAAQFGNIYCLAVDPAWKHMYLADLDNRRIRAIDLTSGIVTTLAGTGTKGARPTAPKPNLPHSSIRALLRPMATETSTSSSAAATHSASSIPRARSTPSSAPARPATPATAATPARRHSKTPSTCASTSMAAS